MEKNDLEPVFYRGLGEEYHRKINDHNYKIKNESLFTAKHSISVTEKIADGVHRSGGLSPKFCSELLEEIERAAQISSNLLDRTGVDLLSLNFDVVVNNIIAALLPTIKQVLEFNIGSNCNLSLLSAYVVGYQYNKPSHHPVHADDSDITLNINLGKTFDGGDLFFLDPVTKQIVGSTSHSVGKVIIHAGDMPHGAKTLKSGERYNLIIWLKKQYAFEQFSALPKEVQRYALNSMDVRQLCRLAQTCKAMKAMIYEADSTWARFIPVNDDSEENGSANRISVIDMHKRNKFSDRKIVTIVREIIYTERVYFASLKHALIHGLQPLYETNSDMINTKDASIVTDLQQIVECHELVLRELDNCVDLHKKEDELNVLNLVTILLLLQRLESYRQYVAKYEDLKNLLRQCEDNKHARKFLLEFKDLPESKGLTLESFMIMPLRRVPRYQLLFTEMQKFVGSLSNGEDVAKLTQHLVDATKLYSEAVNIDVRAREQRQAEEDETDKEDTKGHKRCTIS